jgi:general stress protein 26
VVIPYTKAKKAFFLSDADMEKVKVIKKVSNMRYYYKADVQDAAIEVHGLDGLAKRKEKAMTSKQTKLNKKQKEASHN